MMNVNDPQNMQEATRQAEIARLTREQATDRSKQRRREVAKSKRDETPRELPF